MFVRALLALLCLAAVMAPAAQPSATNRFDREIAAFEAGDRTNPPPNGGCLFIGSSSIRLWKTLAQDFPRHPVFNRGFGGSFIRDSTHFAERIVFPYAPKRIVLFAGGNDLNAGKSVEEVAGDFETFVRTVHARLPETRIAYISISPTPARWAQVSRTRALNEKVAAITERDPRLDFIDVFPHMLGPDGLPKPDIFVADRLHLNAKGYELWKGIVGKFLDAPAALHVFPAPQLAPEPNPGQTVLNESFRLNGKFVLSRVQVSQIPDPTTDAKPKLIWDLAGEAGADPQCLLHYGVPPRGMKPVDTGNALETLRAGQRYRILVRAGALEATADFVPAPISMRIPIATSPTRPSSGS